MAGGDEAFGVLSSFTGRVMDVPISVWGAARVVDRRLQRGQALLETPDFADIGIAADGRVAQAVGVGNAAADTALAELVRRRASVIDREEELKDQRTSLNTL